MTDIEVRYIEVDLPPIQTGLIVHIKPDPGPCMPAIVTAMRYGGEVDVDVFLPPGRAKPYAAPYRFEPGGQTLGTYHRLGECPEQAINAGRLTWTNGAR